MANKFHDAFDKIEASDELKRVTLGFLQAERQKRAGHKIRPAVFRTDVYKRHVVHSRDAAKDTLDIVKVMNAKETGGVIHCFSYSVEIAREYLNMGFYIGIGGVVTFDNAKALKEVTRYAPLDRILLETDCPYLAPVPNRGKRNSSPVSYTHLYSIENAHT